MSGVQRFISNHKNALVGATLTGDVKSIEGAVRQKPVSRFGSSMADLDGVYTGEAEAEIEVEIRDVTVGKPVVTEPIFSGVGSGDLDVVAVAEGLTARTITVELADLGEILSKAQSEIQGITVVVKEAGADGNDLKLRVSRSLTFTPKAISLLTAIPAGTKSISGPEFDWDTKIITGDGLIPETAHRVAFGDNENNIYVQYKQFENGEYVYHFEPAIDQRVEVGTIVKFVTGTYTVELLDGDDSVLETYADIVTLYDLLNAIKTTSTYLLVEGPVLFDRAPGGQAVLELALRTDAHWVRNDAFTQVDILPGASTELVEATCIAAKQDEDYRAGVGHELWEVKGSVSGLIGGEIVTGELFSTAGFSAKIKPKDDGQSTVKGVFDIESVTLIARSEEETTLPGICVNNMTLGTSAANQRLTLTYKKRPDRVQSVTPSQCACVQDNSLLNGDCITPVSEPQPSEGDPLVTYPADILSRLVDLYDFSADTARSNSVYYGGYGHIPFEDPFVSAPYQVFDFPGSARQNAQMPLSFLSVIKKFEQALSLVNAATGDDRDNGLAAWDTAFSELQADVTELTGESAATDETLDAGEALDNGDAVMVLEDSPGVFKAYKAAAGGLRYGFITADVASGDPATVLYVGTNPTITSAGTYGSSATFPAGGGTTQQTLWSWRPSQTVPGLWVLHKGGYNDVSGAGDGTDPGLDKFVMRYISTFSGNKPTVGGDPMDFAYALVSDRYITRLNWVLISANISPLGKFDASAITGGDGCWQDTGADYWWEISGGSGTYAPAFTGVPYYSAKKRNTGGVGYFGTREFAFNLSIPCPDLLEEGDSITLVISGVPTDRGYSKGDKIQLAILGAVDLGFFGGRDGDSTQTWHITDSEDGPRAAYSRNTEAPVNFSDSDLEFAITDGNLAFAKGDKFEFSIEGGHFRWRKIVGGVTGAWSSDLDIGDAPTLLDDGLTITFVPGASPAFYVGDVYRFTALQPYALANILVPSFDAWQWPGSTVELVVDLLTSKTLEGIGIAFHNIPDDATITLQGGADGMTWLWSEAITWSKDIIGKIFDNAQTARYLKLSVNRSGDIGWLWVGEFVKFDNSAKISINRQYKMERSNGPNPYARFKGAAVGSSVEWPEGHLSEADYPVMVELVDEIKKNGDYPIMVFPQLTRQNEVLLATVNSDEVQFNDVYDFQADYGRNRRLSCTLPLSGVMFK